MLLVLRSKLWRAGAGSNASADITGAECTAEAGQLSGNVTQFFVVGGGGSRVKLAPQRTWKHPEEPKHHPKPEPKREPKHEPISISARASFKGAESRSAAGEIRGSAAARAAFLAAECTASVGQLKGSISVSAEIFVIDEELESAALELILSL